MEGNRHSYRSLLKLHLFPFGVGPFNILYILIHCLRDLINDVFLQFGPGHQNCQDSNGRHILIDSFVRPFGNECFGIEGVLLEQDIGMGTVNGNEHGINHHRHIHQRRSPHPGGIEGSVNPPVFEVVSRFGCRQPLDPSQIRKRQTISF